MVMGTDGRKEEARGTHFCDSGAKIRAQQELYAFQLGLDDDEGEVGARVHGAGFVFDVRDLLGFASAESSYFLPLFWSKGARRPGRGSFRGVALDYLLRCAVLCFCALACDPRETRGLIGSEHTCFRTRSMTLSIRSVGYGSSSGAVRSATHARVRA